MSEDLKNPLSSLTGARQTWSAWSKVIESYEAIPKVYAGFFKTQIAANQPVPYLVLIPPLDKLLYRSTEKLIYEANAALCILERTGSQVIATSYPYQSVHTLEVGNILLYSWITISGLTSEGVENASKIEFNPAVGDRHLAVFMNKLRPEPKEADEIELQAEKDKFDYLSTQNFKFMNYGRGSLVRGEKVFQIIFQPEILEPTRKLLGWTFYRRASRPHLLILTDVELILLREDERGKEIRGVRYGCVWQYLPLRSLTSVSLAKTDHQLTLTINHAPNQQLEKLFAISSQPELEQLVAKLQKLIGAVAYAA